MSVVLQSANIIENLITAANSTTGKSDQTLTAAVQSLKDGYKKGGSSGEWTRPAEYPNYDYIDRTGMEAVYFTYNCKFTKAEPRLKDYIAISASTNGGQFRFDTGYIDADGFHSSTSETYNSGASVIKELPKDGSDYIVCKIAPVLDNVHITSINQVSAYGSSVNIQHCVERFGRLPFVKAFNSWGCRYVEHESIIDCTSLTGLASTWGGCSSLQSLDLSGWDVTAVTSLNSAWRDCGSLQALDLSGWNMASVTILTSAWNACNSLQLLSQAVIPISYALNESPLLDDTSLADVIDKLPVVETAQTLTLGNALKSRLTQEQIASATEKGWNIA